MGKAGRCLLTDTTPSQPARRAVLTGEHLPLAWLPSQKGRETRSEAAGPCDNTDEGKVLFRPTRRQLDKWVGGFKGLAVGMESEGGGHSAGWAVILN